jgi:hypothetical protein
MLFTLNASFEWDVCHYVMLCTLNASFEWDVCHSSEWAGMKWSYSKCVVIFRYDMVCGIFSLVLATIWKRERHFNLSFETCNVNDCEFSYNKLILGMSWS